MRRLINMALLAMALAAGPAPKELHAPCGKTPHCPRGLQCLRDAAGNRTCEVVCRPVGDLGGL